MKAECRAAHGLGPSQGNEDPAVEYCQYGHRHEIHDDEEHDDAVPDRVSLVSHERRRSEARSRHAEIHPFVLKVSRYAEQRHSGHRDDDDDVCPAYRAEVLGVQRVADSDVSVHGQKNCEPSIDEAYLVHGGKGPWKDVRQHLVVPGYSDVAKRPQQQCQDEDHGVCDGQGLQDEGRRQDLLVVAEHDQGQDVADYAGHSDRNRDPDLADHPNVDELIVFRSDAGSDVCAIVSIREDGSGGGGMWVRGQRSRTVQ